MNARERYIRLLEEQDNWEELLLQNSGLPGPRANLELAIAVTESGSEEQFLEWSARGPDEASGNSPEGFEPLAEPFPDLYTLEPDDIHMWLDLEE